MSNVVLSTLGRFASFQRPARLLIELGLSVALALVLARIVWLVVSPSDSVAIVEERPLPTPIERSAFAGGLNVDRSILLTANPFQRDDVELVLGDAPETSLNLTLEGLRVSVEGPSSGTAIIRTPDGIDKSYQMGDQILPGVSLKRILTDRVLIERDGVDETVFLNGRQDGLSVISDDSISVPPPGLDAPGAQGVEASPPGFEQAGTIEDPVLLISAVLSERVETETGESGWRLTPRGSPEIMRQAGLMPGDILLEVNGTRVAGLQSDDLINVLEVEGGAMLTIQRDGDPQKIRLSVER